MSFISDADEWLVIRLLFLVSSHIINKAIEPEVLDRLVETDLHSLPKTIISRLLEIYRFDSALLIPATLKLARTLSTSAPNFKVGACTRQQLRESPTASSYRQRRSSFCYWNFHVRVSPVRALPARIQQGNIS